MIENYVFINGIKTILNDEQVRLINQIINGNNHNKNIIKRKYRPSQIVREKENEVLNLLGTCHIQDIVNATGLTRRQIYGIKNKYKDQLTLHQLKRYSPEAIGRLGETNYNNKGTLMKIVEYQNANNIVVEFQDEYKAKVHTRYRFFQNGGVYNPYDKNVIGVGITGDIYPATINGKNTKEYYVWQGIIYRSFDEKTKIEHPTYKDVTCCDEWLFFPNFYDWLHNQPNFDKWFNGERWAVDKDILIKGNKVYSPNACCLVPQRVNQLFVLPTDNGECVLGVRKYNGKFIAEMNDIDSHQNKYIGSYNTEEDAFYYGYKPEKERVIKQVAQEEYDNGNITKECYEAMMNYEVNIRKTQT